VSLSHLSDFCTKRGARCQNMKFYLSFLLSAIAWGGGVGDVGNRKPHSIAKLSPFFILSMERGVGGLLFLFFKHQQIFFYSKSCFRTVLVLLAFVRSSRISSLLGKKCYRNFFTCIASEYRF
jgi:hypothetical protein